MVKHAIEEIVAVEQEIQEWLARERANAATWLSGELKDLERQTEEHLAACEAECRKAREDGLQSLRVRAESLLKEAGEYAKVLEAISDAQLAELARKHLRAISSGEGP